ncbi:MAG: hypothetical protein ACYCVY_08810 [Acidiferrobacteraceae bacterium]
MYLNARTSIGEQQVSGVIAVVGPLAATIDFRVQRRQHGLQGFQIFPRKALGRLVFVALFLTVDVTERRLGGGIPLPRLLFEPDAPHLIPGKTNDSALPAGPNGFISLATASGVFGISPN